MPASHFSDFFSRHAEAAWHIMTDAGGAANDMVPWGFVVFSAIVLVTTHLRTLR